MTVYDERFFEELREGARSSARAVVPLVMRMLAPASVVDVGCGLGTWLAVFAENGISDFLGIDGSYVDPLRLEIPRGRFLPHDLSTPLRLDRRFDLAVSLEVAEHLPGSAAETCVGSLAELAPLVLFSAAIPFQGGTNHVNEQPVARVLGRPLREGRFRSGRLRPRRDLERSARRVVVRPEHAAFRVARPAREDRRNRIRARTNARLATRARTPPAVSLHPPIRAGRASVRGQRAETCCDLGRTIPVAHAEPSS